MLKINDIKSLETIPDYSIYVYYSLIILFAVIVIISIYLIFKHFKNKKESEEKKYYNILKNIDLNDTKKAAYEISKYGRVLAKEERSKELIRELHRLLDEFKYKKEVKEKFSKEIRVKFDIFMESLDVK